MGRLAIRHITYNGEKYIYESPHLGDGIVILEGKNGHGKSTFMNLIYYGLGGKVSSFEKNDANKIKHFEISNDVNNYVELQIEINEKIYELTRYIGNNNIFIVEPDNRTLETVIHRNNSEDKIVFSDWILEKLDIDVFDIIQGSKNFKINFTDLMRLIYHDQETDINEIYKKADNSNFLSDSIEIRRAIFEILIGENYNEYYKCLGEYKILKKEYEKANSTLENYEDIILKILNDKILNIDSIRNKIYENETALSKIASQKAIAYVNKNITADNYTIIDSQKRRLCELDAKKSDYVESEHDVESTIEKLLYLYKNGQRELDEINKVRLINKKLNFFTPDTCPYCLRKIERETNKCICGNDIDENQYEKFFYTDDEYLTIVKVKQKSLKSLSDMLELKKNRKIDICNQIMKINLEIDKIKKYILEVEDDIIMNENSTYIRKLDEKKLELESEKLNLKYVEEIALRRDTLVKELAKIRGEYERKGNQVDILLTKAREDMIFKRNEFSEIYAKLMKDSDEYCFDAHISEDYMPVINLNSYRERSAGVPKRLMYFITLIIESLKNDIKFPKFLMIDTPDKEGIDDDNLMKCLINFNEVTRVSDNHIQQFQIILTTGVNGYPDEYKNKVILTLEENNHLLLKK